MENRLSSFERTSVEGIEQRLSHCWCYDLRSDYINNRLWSGERAIYVAFGLRIRQWLDSYSPLRVKTKEII